MLELLYLEFWGMLKLTGAGGKQEAQKTLMGIEQVQQSQWVKSQWGCCLYHEVQNPPQPAMIPVSKLSRYSHRFSLWHDTVIQYIENWCGGIFFPWDFSWFGSHKVYGGDVDGNCSFQCARVEVRHDGQLQLLPVVLVSTFVYELQSSSLENILYKAWFF